MSTIKYIALSISKYDVNRIDRYFQKKFAPFIVGFLVGFFTLAAWNIFIRLVTK
jgi:predicted negative regulator of RcsB-dependent stress response